ncbi:metal ABC transporter substrate-binding protein [Dactylosporangium sp. NPDC005555]|uniref:metal ABC transporter substrate-binding protein n=1 Tax=Dactylosporangium sp. NPDC005555 TaxID=3154889 RepID=UPI0033B183DA
MMRIRTFAAAATVLAGLAGCGDTGGTPAAAGNGDRLAVVATTTQVADFARAVGGDRVSVTQILKPNIDPHDYEPTAADVTAIGNAAVLVKNGIGLEGWLDATVAAAGFKGTVADASTGVRLRDGSGDGEGEGEGERDPHIWHDPRNAKLMVATIERAFAAAAPADAAVFERNLGSYTTRLDELDATIAARIASLPPGNRKLVTNHDAFGYYIDRYGLQYVGAIIPSFDTSAELSAKDVDDIVAKIRRTGTTAVFSESSLPPKTAEAIGRQAGVKVVAGEDALYGDTLGPEGSDGDTYLKMETHNTDTIVRALGG